MIIDSESLISELYYVPNSLWREIGWRMNVPETTLNDIEHRAFSDEERKKEVSDQSFCQ